ncbi:unnamed protein product [Rotaria magnacalcarata]|uniref:Uncharacterized protein n=1 Tax=Rotaria magnacalcarata TaxID=392030 RepID=A0A815HLY8_9BILA|nr:unnamed protein product [Rotaria magnacalcarata]CAF1353987.1 unnamed protein product [Rotaria magnacalcarata]CAF2104825.1 unnamed protein product [Rotaria magnacalcarata]CAF2225567.1 unnamed protein product [Rotaria magnacalcarata]CAF3942171.1 unnamed protein product [Rotaria magnacalcarata]
MATNICSTHPMPVLVIDDCSSEENEELIKTITTSSSSKKKSVSRSLSLPNHREAYTDLSGTIHYSSSSNRLKNLFTRSYSYPTNFFSHDKSFYFQSYSNKIHMIINLLDPNNGIHSPGGSSSRYSLYGSFFDLSESGCHSPYSKADNRLITNDGCLLLTVDKSSKLSTNTYQEKCNDWLSQLDII